MGERAVGKVTVAVISRGSAGTADYYLLKTATIL